MEGISLTPHYHFHSYQRYLDIRRVVTAESSPLHIGSSRTWTGNLWCPSANRQPFRQKNKKYSQFQTINTSNSKHFFRFHIKQYWHFHWVTPKQYYTLFQTSNNTDIFRELLVNNTTHFSRVYIKQYWHFQRVPSKLNYSKNFFQSSYHTILTLSESYYQTILTYLELVSNSIHTFTELLPNNSKHFFESLNGHLNRQKILKRKILN